MCENVFIESSVSSPKLYLYLYCNTKIRKILGLRGATLWFCENMSGGRLILAPTGNMTFSCRQGTASSLPDTKRRLQSGTSSPPTHTNSTTEDGIIPENLMADVLANLHITKEMGSLMDALQAATTKAIVVAFAKHCSNYNPNDTHVVNKLRFIIQNNINAIIHRLTKSISEFAKKTDKYASEMPYEFCDEGQEYVIFNRMRCLAGDESCATEIGENGGLGLLRPILDRVGSFRSRVEDLIDASSTRRRNMPTKSYHKLTSPISYEYFEDGREIIEKAEHRNKFINKKEYNRPADITKLKNSKAYFKGRDEGSRSSSIEIQENNPNIIENSNIRNERVDDEIVPDEEIIINPADEEPDPKHKAPKRATYEYDTDDSDAIRSKSSFIPKTVKLSKANKDFYNDRKWPGGVVRYMIGVEDPKYNLADLRERLYSVNAILKEKTCVRLVEIKQKAKERYNDYIVLDTSPDYVTGRVGKEQLINDASRDSDDSDLEEFAYSE